MTKANPSSNTVAQKSEESTENNDHATLDMPRVLWEQLYSELRYSLKHETDGWKKADIDEMEAVALKKDIRRGPLQGKEEFTLSQEQLTCCWQANCDFHEAIRHGQRNVPARSQCRHQQVAHSLVLTDEILNNS